MSKKTKLHIPVNDPTYDGSGGGTYGFTNWSGFETLLRAAGNLKKGEHVAGVDVSHNGIQFRIEKIDT